MCENQVKPEETTTKISSLMSKLHENHKDDLLELAIELAASYHKEQKDKAGKPYI